MIHTVRSRLMAILLLALAAYGVERLIVTDEEAIENLAEALAEDIRGGRWAALEGRLHEDFTYGRLSREKTVEHVRGLVKRYRPTDIGVSLYEIKIDGDDATAQGQVWGHVGGRRVGVTIAVKLTRTEDDGWILREVTGGSRELSGGRVGR